MKLHDLGEKQDKMGMPVEANKKKIHYPTISSNKDMKVVKGQKVKMEGVISGTRDDSYGKSFTIEVHKFGLVGKMSDEEFEKMSDEEQDKTLEKGR